jgi:aspartate-semialdehyde dehydrogenase
VPEINGKETKKSKLIANPNCTTAIGLMALWPLHQAFTLKKIIMSTYQAASGAGQEGMDELKIGTKQWLDTNGAELLPNQVFAHSLPFNVIPHIDQFQDNGYTKEEMKVVWESRKICGLAPDFPISCTAVRIPTIRAHSESIIVETEKPIDITVARQVLSQQSGLKLMDDTKNNIYPMPLSCTGSDDVEVGRLRKSLIYDDYGLEFFVCGDQLLRGAALNAVLIAEEMIRNGAISTSTTKSSTISA